MHRYIVEFEFIENGHKCHTAYSGEFRTDAEAVKFAREWFGFDKDGIEVTKISVRLSEIG